ncbi:MAG: hypothetical protein R2748_28025 [Bryobacterales bacterium]
MVRLVLLCLVASVPLAAQESISFLVRMGLTDPAPRSWDGSVSAVAGKVTGLRSWRPRGADRIEGTKWSLATTKGQKFKYRNWEPEPSSPVPDYVYTPGLFMTVEGGPDTRLTLNTDQGAVSFRVGDVPVGERKLYLNAAVSVERAAGAESVSGDGYENGFADVVGDGKAGWWVAWVGYKGWANRVMVRRFDGAAWGETEELTGASDVYMVRLAYDGRGGVWAVWSEQKDGNFDLYARRYDGQSWGPAERMTAALGPDIHPALANDSDGGVWLAWQGFRNEQSEILARHWDGERWTGEEVVSVSDSDDWNPAIATDANGGVWIAWDTYDKGDYDVVMRGRQGERFGELIQVANTPRYEAYPSIACDAEGRVWAAWNESDMQWGKDTGFLVLRPATQLYQSRWIRTAVYGNGEWRSPAAELEASLPEDLRGFNDFPRLRADGAGRVWAVFRHRFLKQREVPPTAASHRAAWETFATAFDGRGWSTPTPLPATQGRSDTGLGVAKLAGGALVAAWATDNRDYDEFFFEKGEIFSARLPEPPGKIVEARLKPYVRDELEIFQNHPNEAEDVARVREYTVDAGGKQYKIYRGDMHRHTEYSHDGNNDGSLNDTYRYALDAANFDYLGLSEHHSSGGPNIEYINWLLQQRVDVFSVPRRFTPLYGYERGLSYPQGHRNVFFSDRGNPTFPNVENENDPSVGAKPLYAYLKKYNGITMSHTSATGMGTDWRDNDPEVEPLVEIYQGDRVSAEYEGAPKAAVGNDVTTQAGGFKPKGYVWNAWAKGYKLGVQASSDHLSTHVSYANLIAEEHSREGLMDAIRKRHAYASTDNIILDYRLKADGKEFIQGDIVDVASPRFEFRIKVVGTGPIKQIDVIRNNEFMLNLQNQGSTVDFAYADQAPVKGESYYYVRVQQANGQMAWSSPIWVRVP